MCAAWVLVGPKHGGEGAEGAGVRVAVHHAPRPSLSLNAQTRPPTEPPRPSVDPFGPVPTPTPKHYRLQLTPLPVLRSCKLSLVKFGLVLTTPLPPPPPSLPAAHPASGRMLALYLTPASLCARP